MPNKPKHQYLSDCFFMMKKHLTMTENLFIEKRSHISRGLIVSLKYCIKNQCYD